jgi:uncharacterized protein YneF (UPF0154 family)
MSASTQFLVAFVAGGVLMILGLIIGEWMSERKFNRERLAAKEKVQK